MEKEAIISKTMWPQWMASIGVTLLMIQIGMMTGWSSPYVAYLTSFESRMPVTMDEASLVVSLLNLGRLFGAIFGSAAVNYLGSKTTILIVTLPLSLCWLLTIAANRVEWLYAARSLGGIGMGMTYSSFSLYLGEIADPAIRGALVVLAMSGIPIGSLMICLMGAYLSMNISGIVSFLLCIVLIIIFMWLPESPHHFIKIKREDKARASIAWYYRDRDVESELKSLKEFVETNNSLPVVDVLKEFTNPHIGKALLLVLVLHMYGMMCGLNNIFFYMETILRSAKVTVIDPSVVVIIVTAFGIGSSLLSMVLIDKFGRRILMIVSSLSCAVSLTCLAVQFQLLDAGHDTAKLQALPIFAMLLFEASLFVGILSVPNTVLSEIFPPHVKCVAACLCSIALSVLSFISTSTYQPLIDLLTEKYVFYLYTALQITAIPYTLLCMPETKGKSLQKIQQELSKKS